MKISIKFFLLIMILLAVGTIQFFESVLFNQDILTHYESILPYFNAKRFQDLWGIMYLYIGIVFWVVLINRHRPFCRYASTSFAITLIISIIWSYIFFSDGSVLIAGFIMFIFVLSSLFTLFYFSQVNRIAALFFIAYVLWVILVSYMNLIAFLHERDLTTF